VIDNGKVLLDGPKAHVLAALSGQPAPQAQPAAAAAPQAPAAPKAPPAPAAPPVDLHLARQAA
jgi:ATP-binding cassette subfamily C protein LapB